MQTIAIERMIAYYGKDVNRINHALKVYGFAFVIARKENLAPKKLLVVDLAGILHDIGIVEAKKKYNSHDGKYQEMEGPAVVKQLLADTEIDPETLDRVCYIVGNHHSYQKIDGIDFQILVEADFLVNIFEEKMSEKSIQSIKQKYIKTATGLAMIEKMYL